MEAPLAPAPMGVVVNRFEHKHYLLKRHLLKLIGGAISVYDPYGNEVLYVEQKGFKLKEDVRIFADKTKGQELVSIKARNVIDFSAVYDVVDSQTGQQVGSLQRKGMKSIIKDEWWLLDSSGVQIGRVFEDHIALALIRRFLTNLVPQSYDVEHNGNRVAEFKQRFNPMAYNMDIDFSADGSFSLDRRLGLSAAIMLVLIEGRQSG